MGFGSPSEVAQAPSRCQKTLVPQSPRTPGITQAPNGNASLEVSDPFSVFQLGAAAACGRDCLTRPPAPSGFPNLLAPSSAPSLPALFHAGSALGVTLQSFVPPAQPHAISGAVPLLTFGPLMTRAPVSRVFLRARVRHQIQRFKPRPGALLSWVFFPPGYSRSP